jgi:hypothetical protein
MTVGVVNVALGYVPGAADPGMQINLLGIGIFFSFAVPTIQNE